MRRGLVKGRKLTAHANIVYCGLFICTGVTDVKLRVFAPHTNESFATICPNDNYLLVVQCIVTETASITWTVTPLTRVPVTFSSIDIVGETTEYGVDFIFYRERLQMDKDIFTYISQVELQTDLIRQTVGDHGEIEVTCATSSKIASVLLDIQGMYVTAFDMYVLHITSEPCSQ